MAPPARPLRGRTLARRRRRRPPSGAGEDRPSPRARAGDAVSIWDPAVRKYRMYASVLLTAHVPMWQSDRVEGPWEWAGDALVEPPEWASDDFCLWTPEVTNIDGVWTLWGSAGVRGSLAFASTAPRARARRGRSSSMRVPPAERAGARRPFLAASLRNRHSEPMARRGIALAVALAARRGDHWFVRCR